MNNFIKHFIWTVVIGGILYLGFQIQVYLEEVAKTEFRMEGLVIFGTLFPVFVGVLLRLPRLIQEVKEGKQWTVNWGKLIVVGLPAFYIIITQLFSLLHLGTIFHFHSKLHS